MSEPVIVPTPGESPGTPSTWEPLPPPPVLKPFPGILQSIGLLVLIQVIANGIALAILAPPAVKDYLENGGLTRPFPIAEVGIVANSLAFGLVTWFTWKWSRLPAREAFPIRRVRIGAWLPVLVTFGGAVVAALLVSAALLYFWPPPPQVLEIFRQLLSDDTSLVAAVVFLVVVAPVTEELFFRGVLQRGLARRYGRRKSVIWSGILFGLMHGLPWQVFPAMILGFVFAYWTDRTGSLWPALVGHAVNNGAQLAFSRMTPDQDPSAPAWPDLPTLAAGAVLLLAGYFLSKRFLHPATPETVVERSFP